MKLSSFSMYLLDTSVNVYMRLFGIVSYSHKFFNTIADEHETDRRKWIGIKHHLI